MNQVSPPQLYKLLDRYFNTSELRELAYDLNIDYESLGGVSKKAQAIELVQYAHRHGRLQELIEATNNRRPNIAWEEFTPKTTTSTRSSEEDSLLNEFYEKANRLQQQFQAIQDLTNLSADEAQKLLNQFEDAPHELLRELLLASDYDPDLVAYAEQFADLEHRFGTALVSQGKWYEGLRRLERGLTIRRLLDDLDARADTIYQIGRVYHLMSDLAEAQIRYRDALRLYEHTKNEEGIAICNLNLGNLAIQLGYIDEGITKIELAKDFYRKTKNYNRLHEIEEIVNLVTHIREKEMA